MNLRPSILLGIVVSMITGVGLGIITVRYTTDREKSQFADTLSRVADHIEESYVEEISRQTLLENAIDGMLKGLDQHSVYLNADTYATLQEETLGHFGGVGVEIALVDGMYRVIAPIDETPAANAGIQSGDTIVELNHKSMRGQLLRDVLRQMRGEPGSRIHLGIMREPDQRLDFDLTRATITINSAKARLLEPGIGYLRISQFQIDTPQQMLTAIEELQQSGELDGLVLDLRNNPGGVLTASVAVADAFLSEGLIVYTQGRNKANKLRFEADSEDVLEGTPMVVLINSGSASAAEIVAGALKDNGRAAIVGTTSYGKGSVQSVVPLTKSNAIKLTTARYFTPSGVSIQSQGIDPDITVTSDEETILLAEAVKRLRQG